jgi:hypothetical protein
MIHIFTPVITPRIRYISDLIFRDHLRFPYLLTADREAWNRAGGAKINYSHDIYPDALQIPPSGIMTETCARGLGPEGDPMKGASGKTGGPDLDPTAFDLFGAAFYLLSRYEEYLPGALFDPKGRFDPSGSWAYRHGCLERPLVDEWIHALGERLRRRFSLPGAPGAAFTFCPTYDIDIPWCYLHKGLPANLLGMGRDILTGRWGRLSERRKVLGRQLPDPFDNFDWMDNVNLDQPWAPIYFFPLASGRSAYDKNPSPAKKAYRELIRRHDTLYPVGIHPSFYSTTRPGLVQKETDELASILERPVTLNRFHYIRFRLPEDYRLLLAGGIRADYSMGYGGVNGFRASYSRPFRWYDLQKEVETSLEVVPYCYMEASGYRRWGQRQEEALAEIDQYLRRTRAVGGQMTVIWHNNSLSDIPRWIGWRRLYAALLQKAKTPCPTL